MSPLSSEWLETVWLIATTRQILRLHYELRFVEDKLMTFRFLWSSRDKFGKYAIGVVIILTRTTAMYWDVPSMNVHIDRIGSPLALARYTFAAQFWCAFTDFTIVVRMLWLFGFASHMLSVGFCCVSIADQVAEMSSPSRYYCEIWIGRFSSCVLVRFNQEMCLYYTDQCKILKPHEQ